MSTDDVAAWIAGLSGLVAIASAIFAYQSRKAADRSAVSAERANDINLHQSKLEIYKAFQAFQGALLQRGQFLAESDVFPFIGSAHLSEFYFPYEMYEQLKEIVDDALSYLGKADEVRQTNDIPDLYTRPERTSLRAELSSRHKALREKCDKLDKLMRAELRLFKRA